MNQNASPLGCTLTEYGANFKVWAPHAKEVFVTGSFNHWNDQGFRLSREDDNWLVFVEGVSAGDEYQFRIVTAEGETLLRNDPRARLLTNSAGNSVVYDPNYDWRGDEFTIPDWNELVIYELHIGTFNKPDDSVGSFSTAEEKLIYLKELGINAIEIMPVAEFPGDLSWGYNPSYPFSVETAYGGPDGLKSFVRAAHDNGIAVILDVVYNHFGPSDLDLWQFDGWSQNGKGGIYFYNDWRSATPWGDTRPDYGRGEVRQFIYDNAMMWLDEFHIDGLRMDMVPFMRTVDGTESPDSSIAEAYDLIRWMNHDIVQKHPKALLIAEDLHGNDFITDDVCSGGCGYGAQWDADFVHPVRAFLEAIEDDHRNLDELVSALTRRYSRGTFHRIVYTESHDETANGRARVPEEISSGDVDNDSFAKRRAMQGIALTLTAPGIPMLLQGQELLAYEWFSDEKPVLWERSEKFSEFQDLVTRLIQVRRDPSSGFTREGFKLVWQDNDNKVLAFQRFAGEPDDGSLILFNFSAAEFDNYRIDLESTRGDWQVALIADEVPREATNFACDRGEGNLIGLNLTLPAYGLAVLR